MFLHIGKLANLVEHKHLRMAHLVLSTPHVPLYL